MAAAVVLLANDNDDADVFVYTGIREGAVVPRDVVRVRIDPSVLAIPHRAFAHHHNLGEVELHDGLREIGPGAFSCCRSLKEVQSSGGVESIGIGAFYSCVRFNKFRIPPLITTIPLVMLNNCTGLFSLELPENTIEVGDHACHNCHSLRNAALTSNIVVDNNAFQHCTDLLHIFGTYEAIVDALQNRFNRLPVHCKMYYISYYPEVLEEIRNIIMSENRELDSTGFQQDCLGMTPLHILACSTVQLVELYQLMVDNFPGNLIVEDAWGATPLLYAIWGDAPNEIVEFLVNSYQSLYPNHEFDWNDMVITLGRASTSGIVIQNLLGVQLTLSPGYNIDWDQILGVLAERALVSNKPVASPETFCFLTRCSIATRVKAIGVKHFRNAMDDYWMGDDHDYFNGHVWRAETLTKLEYYESEYLRLKESTSLLELTLWKTRIDESKDCGEATGGSNKKMKMDGTDFRLQCRISCGADLVVENVWPYLLPSDFVRSYVDDDEDDDEVDDEEEDDDDDNDFIENIDDGEENEEH
jgi:hypothetical protein